MPVRLTTELDAINTMLSIIGEAPVNRVEDTGLVDAVMARQILDETMRQVQSHGWHWNTDKNVVLVPSFPAPGDVYVPDNTLQVDAMDPSIDVVQRGNRLWDRRNNTFKFSVPVEVEIVRLLPFEELPQIARHYIMVRAGRIFQDRVVGSETLSGFNDKDETRALIALRNAEAETADYNMLSDSWAVGRVLNRRSGGFEG
ncbi:tail protein [Azorhizobium caulinodans]|nr:tail protein [Azorhizobium caulinodans]